MASKTLHDQTPAYVSDRLPHATSPRSAGTGPTWPGNPPGRRPWEACHLRAFVLGTVSAWMLCPSSLHRSDMTVSERTPRLPCFLHGIHYSMWCPCSYPPVYLLIFCHSHQNRNFTWAQTVSAFFTAVPPCLPGTLLEETQALSSLATCSRPHSWQYVEVRFKFGFF